MERAGGNKPKKERCLMADTETKITKNNRVLRVVAYNALFTAVIDGI